MTERKPKMKEKRQPPPGLTIDEIIALANKLSKERGRYVSYGEVTREIETGKLKVKKGRKLNG